MNFLQKFAAIATFAGGIAIAGIAAATPVVFDFTGSNLSDRSSISYTVDGITVTVTAGTFGTSSNPSNINFSTRRVDIDPEGLGADRWYDDDDDVDGRFGNDVLVFSFSEEVEIESIGFGNVDGNDDFSFGTVSGSSYTRVVNFRDVMPSSDVSGLAGLGLAFGIGAIGNNDNFTVASLSVSAVPLPASGLMLLAAMGLGAGVARRRKAKAA